MSVQDGRGLYDQAHARSAEREKLPAPKRGESSVTNGRALYDNRGMFAAHDD